MLAHPFTLTRSRGADEALVEQMYAAGLVGLEAFHRDHGPEQIARAEALAERLGLLLTGSSDYHGAGKLNRLGEHTTDPDVLDAIEQASSGVTTDRAPLTRRTALLGKVLGSARVDVVSVTSTRRCGATGALDRPRGRWGRGRQGVGARS